MDYSLLTNKRQWTNTNSGIAAMALIAPFDWFVPDTGIKSPLAPFTTAGDGITIKTPHEFIIGKGFLFFSLAIQKNQLDAPVSGDPGFYKQTQEATIFIPGSDPALHETFQTLMNTKLIVLVKDSTCKLNMYYQLGCDCEPAILGGAFNTGTTKDGVKGFNAKVIYDGPPQFYIVEGGPAILADN